jgi:hypothetical protein
MNITIEAKQNTEEAKTLIRKFYDDISVCIDDTDYVIERFDTFSQPVGIYARETCVKFMLKERQK